MGNGIVHKQLNPAINPNSLSGSSHIISEPVDSICSIFAAKPDLKEVFITFLRDEKWIERFHERADDITSYNPTSQLCYPQYITPTGDVFGSKDSSLCKKKGIRAVSHRSTLSHAVSSSNLNADTKKKAKKTKECMVTVDNIFLLVIAVAIPIFLQSEEFIAWKNRKDRSPRLDASSDFNLSSSVHGPPSLATPSRTLMSTSQSTPLLSRQNTPKFLVPDSPSAIPSMPASPVRTVGKGPRPLNKAISFTNRSRSHTVDSEPDDEVKTALGTPVDRKQAKRTKEMLKRLDDSDDSEAEDDGEKDLDDEVDRFIALRRQKLLQQQALLHPGDAAAAGAESPTKTTAALHPSALSLSRQNSSSLHSNHAPSPKVVRVPNATAAKRGPVVNEDESLDDLLKASTSAMDIDVLMPKLASSDWLREMFDYLDAFPYAITIASVIPNSSSAAPDFAYCFANQAFETMTKYRRHALLGRATSSILFHPHKTEAAQIDRINQSLSQRKSVKLAMTCQCRDGSTFYNLLALRPVVNGQGDFSFVVGVHYNASAHLAAHGGDGHSTATSSSGDSQEDDSHRRGHGDSSHTGGAGESFAEELMAVDSLLTLLAGLLM